MLCSYRKVCIAAAALSIAASAALGGIWLHQQAMRVALVSTPADALPRRRGLMRLAAGLAVPVYRNNCAGCHGSDLRGDPQRGAPNLIDDDWLYGTGQLSEIERTVMYGIRSHNPKGHNLAMMPSFAAPNDPREKFVPLRPAEINDIVNYLLRVEGRPGDPAAAARGAALYAEKGGCYDCHSPDLKGDDAIGAPNLADSIWLYRDGSRESMFHSIEYGHAGVCPAFIGRLTPLQIRVVAAGIYARAHPQQASASSTGPQLGS